MPGHNVLKEIKQACANDWGDSSLTMSGLDSLLIDSSALTMSATNMTLSATDISMAGTAIMLGKNQTVLTLEGAPLVIQNPGSGTRTVAINAGTSISLSATQLACENTTTGFFSATPVVQPSAGTAATTLISATAPSAATSAINSTSNTSTTVGFSSLNNFRTVIRAISNLQTRMGEVENALSDLGLTA